MGTNRTGQNRMHSIHRTIYQLKLLIVLRYPKVDTWELQKFSARASKQAKMLS